MQSLNENRIVGCFCLFDMFVSVFEEVITLRCSVKKFTVSLKHTTIIYISISTLVTPELQIFVFAIKFKYFKNSLFYYYYPNQLFQHDVQLMFFSELLPCPPLPTSARRSSQADENMIILIESSNFMYFCLFVPFQLGTAYYRQGSTLSAYGRCV